MSTLLDPRAVEALAKELDRIWEDAPGDDNDGFRAVARFILDREAALVEALERLARLGNGDRLGTSIGNVIAQEALAAHRAATAPSEPTLEQAVADARAASVTAHSFVTIPHDKWLRVERALDSERATGGRK